MTPILIVIALLCGPRHVNSKMEATAIHCQKKFLKCVQEKVRAKEPVMIGYQHTALEECLLEEKK